MKPLYLRFVRLAGIALLFAAGWLAAQLTPTLFAQNKNAPAEKSPPPTVLPPNHDREIVAYVNNQPITRRELGEELIARRGKEHLKLLINRKIIEQACRQEGITVTDQEVNDDLLEMARGFKCHTLAEFERSILRQRQLTLWEYKEDVTRPALMFRKLAGKRCEPTAEELQKAYEANYGTKVQCRMILEKDRHKANTMWRKVFGKTEKEFMEVAMTQTTAPDLASVAGLVAPINRYSALGEVEKAAFSLKDGDVSHLIETPQGWVILYRIKEVPPQKHVKFEDVRDILFKDILDKKVAIEAPKIFKDLEAKAQVRDYLNYQSTFMDAATRIDEARNPDKPVPDPSKFQPENELPVPPPPMPVPSPAGKPPATP